MNKPTGLRATLLILYLVVLPGAPSAADLDSPLCREFPVNPQMPSGDGVPYGEGLLWELSKDTGTNYILGTIHISDPDIKQLPNAVKQVTERMERLVVEVVPSITDLRIMSEAMFTQSGQGLRGNLDEQLFSRTVEILARYRLNEQLVSMLKPWAAYMTMSYPPSDDPIMLDLHLMQIAHDRGIDVRGLETLTEQLGIFEDLSESDQVQLLIDTVCHYSKMEQDFTTMKELYKARKLGVLYNFVMQSVELVEGDLHTSLLDALIDKRNIRMSEVMQEYLREGDALIAVGAMHLPGENGILKLLEKKGYSLRKLY